MRQPGLHITYKIVFWYHKNWNKCYDVIQILKANKISSIFVCVRGLIIRTMGNLRWNACSRGNMQINKQNTCSIPGKFVQVTGLRFLLTGSARIFKGANQSINLSILISIIWLVKLVGNRYVIKPKITSPWILQKICEGILNISGS